MKITAILSIVLVIVFNSCSGSDTEKTTTLKTGKYNYTLTDSAGTILVDGEMMLDKITKQKDVPDYMVTGSYTIKTMTTDTSYHGFSTMSGGELTGYYSDEKKFLNINTNPRIADANVFINVSVKSSLLEGSWYYSTFRGMDKEGGLFKAARIKK